MSSPCLVGLAAEINKTVKTTFFDKNLREKFQIARRGLGPTLLTLWCHIYTYHQQLGYPSRGRIEKSFQKWGRRTKKFEKPLSMESVYGCCANGCRFGFHHCCFRFSIGGDFLDKSTFNNFWKNVWKHLQFSFSVLSLWFMFWV